MTKKELITVSLILLIGIIIGYLIGGLETNNKIVMQRETALECENKEYIEAFRDNNYIINKTTCKDRYYYEVIDTKTKRLITTFTKQKRD